MDAAAIEAAGRRIAAAGDGPPRTARDPVNLPMIRNWLEAMGDTNPVYERDGVAPPAMTQVWTMRGLRPAAGPVDPLRAMSAVLDEAGFTSVVVAWTLTVKSVLSSTGSCTWIRLETSMS